jgi:hypothetical protein
LATNTQCVRRLDARLDRIEHCLFLAETVVAILQSDSHIESDSIVTALGSEAASALEALAQARQNLELLHRFADTAKAPDRR